MDATAPRIALAHIAGSGAPIVCLQVGAGVSATASLLSQQFRVLTFTIAGTAGARDDAAVAELANAVGAHASEPVSLIADAASANAALRLAAARPDQVRALALIAPSVPDKVFAEFKTPVMALFGTRDAPAEIGRKMRDAISGCHVMFVYDTDRDMVTQRPEAVAAILREFLIAGARFVVTSKSGKLYP
jgi:pimeloyl-ACP methyl ester carboxylesterase